MMSALQVDGASTQEVSSLLIAENDNSDTSRSAGNQTVLMGAIAAAGLALRIKSRRRSSTSPMTALTSPRSRAWPR